MEMNKRQVAAMDEAVKKAPHRRIVNIGGNPGGDVFLNLDDGSIVALNQKGVDFIVKVNREGLEQGRVINNGN